jgi:hypothetical protein
VAKIDKRTLGRNIVFGVITLFLSNLNALVDTFFHPEISYFDEEHLIVGGFTGFTCIILFIMLSIYLRHLNRAMAKIETLESFLSICSYCKRIRIPGSDPKFKKSWQQFETYIKAKTKTEFSHGVCPDCFPKTLSVHSRSGNHPTEIQQAQP